MEDFQSSDVGVQLKAIAKADSLIATLDEPYRTKVNKTTVNTNPLLQPSLVKRKKPEHKVNSSQSYSPSLSVLVFVTKFLFVSVSLFLLVSSVSQACIYCAQSLCKLPTKYLSFL